MAYIPPVRKLANPPTAVDLWVDAFCTRLGQLYPALSSDSLVVTCVDVIERYKSMPPELAAERFAADEGPPSQFLG